MGRSEKRSNKFDRSMGILAVGLVVTAMLGCASGPKTHPVTLASGPPVEVIDEKVSEFKDVRGVQQRIYSIEYVSAQNFEDQDALYKEMGQVFAVYQSRVDQQGFKKFNLTPVKRDAGGGWEGRPFYLERRPDGRWNVL
jgi:hypothetical protein